MNFLPRVIIWDCAFNSNHVKVQVEEREDVNHVIRIN